VTQPTLSRAKLGVICAVMTSGCHLSAPLFFSMQTITVEDYDDDVAAT